MVDDITPLLQAKHFAPPSAFRPENLSLEARRQKNVAESSVPTICVLDPDGDIVRHLQATGVLERCLGRACYHTDLWIWNSGFARLCRDGRPGSKPQLRLLLGADFVELGERQRPSPMLRVGRLLASRPLPWAAAKAQPLRG